MATNAGGPAAERRVAVFDLDGTITRYDTFLRYLVLALGRSPRRWVRIPALAVAYGLFAAGLRSNAWAKARAIALVLAGQPAAERKRDVERFTARVLRRGVRHGALRALASHQRAGEACVLLTAAPDFYAEPLGTALGAVAVVCTRTARDAGGRLTGELVGENCRGEEKVRRLTEWLKAQPPGVRLVAYGNHGSDWPLLRRADSAVIVNASRSLARRARGHGIAAVRW